MSSIPEASEQQTALPLLTVTLDAANKVYQLMQEEGNFDLKLRVYIEGGGCSGFQYGFTFDEEQQHDDMVFTKEVSDEEEGGGESGGKGAVHIIIDPMSFQYLVGAEIDYKDDLNGARFIIRNPNASTTCGCGSSFSI